MNRKFISIFTILVIATLSACGPAPTPTMSIADLQNTAVADAWAAVTQTQAAIPTSTPTVIPPTETPTEAIIVFPTIAIQPTVAIGSPTADACNDVPPAKPKGNTVNVKFVNKSNGIVGPFSFGMLQPNALGECGTYVFYLGKFDAPVVTILAGCYWGYAIITSPSSVAKTTNDVCVKDATKTVSIWITKELINFH